MDGKHVTAIHKPQWHHWNWAKFQQISFRKIELDEISIELSLAAKFHSNAAKGTFFTTEF